MPKRRRTESTLESGQAGEKADRANLIAERARAGFKELKGKLSSGSSVQALWEEFVPHHQLGLTQFRKVMKDTSLRAGRAKVSEALAAAYLNVRKTGCDRCTFLERLSRRVIHPLEGEALPLLPKSYFGTYRSFTPIVTRREFLTEDEIKWNVMYHDAEIAHCSECERPVFRVQQRGSQRWRTGGLIILIGRIHIVLLENEYVQHVIMRIEPDVEEQPLRGIALFDPDVNDNRIAAECINFVKKGTPLWNEVDLGLKMSNDLKSRQKDNRFVVR